MLEPYRSKNHGGARYGKNKNDQGIQQKTAVMNPHEMFIQQVRD
jgi:hypothetical protein